MAKTSRDAHRHIRELSEFFSDVGVATEKLVDEFIRDYKDKKHLKQSFKRMIDQGLVVKATRVEILPEDTVDDLQQRVLPIEHRVQIDLLKDVAKGNIRELTGGEKLVRPGEEQTLSLAKKIARLMYPHG